MDAVLSERVSTGWACHARGLLTFHFYQTDSMEIHPEGRTVAEACERMLDFLVRAIESACQPPNRTPLRLALIDPSAVDPRCMNRA